MSFVIVTTMSPEFSRAGRAFLPSWKANAGADSIVIHRIDEGSWPANIVKRSHIIRQELLNRIRHKQRVLVLDVDCIVLRNLADGFSPNHPISVARWPHVNMGVAFFNLSVKYRWKPLLDNIVAEVEKAAKVRFGEGKELDQAAWRPRLHQMESQVWKLAEWEWNYNSFEMEQWREELPKLRDIVRVLHVKGHANWQAANLNAKLKLAKRLWPRQLRTTKAW